MAYGNGGTGTAASNFPGDRASVAPPRQPVILEQMLTLEQRTEALNQLVSELSARIEIVLMPSPPPNAKDAPGSLHPGVELGASLAQTNDRLSMIAQRLRDVIERVEL